MSIQDKTPRKTTLIDNEEYEIRVLGVDELPLTLPEIEDYSPAPDGRSPLAKTDWINIYDSKGDVIGKRESDTMPNWAGSSWYYLRFTDPKNTEAFASQENLKYWLPVDHYFGGGEHTTVHLLYSRFWHKVLYNLGHVPTSEPYLKRTNGGILLAEDGTKMSKSKGNVINPEDKLDLVGADALRLYLNFIGPYEATVAWQEGGLVACKRLVDNVFRLQKSVAKGESTADKKLLIAYHKMVKKITECLEDLKNNIAVAELMTFVNVVKEVGSIPEDIWLGFLQVLAPFAPHTTEELWYQYHGFDENDLSKSIHLSSWPQYNPDLVIDDIVTIAVQINGKLRSTFEIDLDAPDDVVLAKAQEQVSKWLDGKQIKFSKVVPNKLVTFAIADS